MTNENSKQDVKRNLDDKTDNTNALEWQAQFSQSVVEEIHKLIEEQAVVYGRDFGDLARSNIIASLVSSTVYKALVSVPKRPGEKNIMKSTDEHHVAYRGATESIQHAIEAGFEAATKRWSGNPREYYCNISIVPQPLSKQIN